MLVDPCLPATRCAILLSTADSSRTVSTWVDAYDTLSSLLRRLSLSATTATLAGSVWQSTSHGFFHGMHIRLCSPQPCAFSVESAVPRETTPSQRRPGPYQVRPGAAAAAGIAEHSRLALSLADCIPHSAPAFGFGISSAMRTDALASYSLSALSVALQDVPACNADARAAWQSMEPLPPDVALDELFFFVDGSFNPDNGCAAWALVAIGRVGTLVGKLGFMANFIHQGVPSAYTAELEALLHAEALATAVDCPLVHIASDCQSALLVSSGQAAAPPGEHVAHAAVSLFFAHYFQRRFVFRHKVDGHSGCAFNELADSIAKAFTCHQQSPGLFHPGDAFWAAVQEGFFHWSWLLDCGSSPLCPSLSVDGNWSRATCDFPESSRPATIGTAAPVHGALLSHRLQLDVVQYNCLSLRGLAARELMNKGLCALRPQIAFFQETRTSQDPISSVGQFWVLSSDATSAGMEGCQIWLHQGRSVSDQCGNCWQRSSFTIVHAEPRILIVLADAGGLRFGLVSAHAPTAAASEETLARWWAHLTACLHKLPPACIPICGIDANARFVQDPRQPATFSAPPRGRNAEALVHFAAEHCLWISHQFDEGGRPLTSWISPTGSRALLDYVLCPRDWAPVAVTRATPVIGDLHQDIDHFPVRCHLGPRLQSRQQPRARKINWRGLASPLGQQVAHFALATAPAVGWDVDVTTHVDVLHQHFLQTAERFLPAPVARVRSPVYCDATLQLILNRRSLRRTVRNTARTASRCLVAVCFGSWRRTSRAAGSARSAPDPREVRDLLQARRNAARWYVTLALHCKDTYRAMSVDRAAFFRKANTEARAAGPAQFAHRIRAILRTGRRFKTPMVLPVLEGRAGPAFGRDAVLSELGDFFAEAERAQRMDINDLLETNLAASPDTCCLDASDIPSVSLLASSFASLQPHKAAGLSQIPADFYRCWPLQSAHVFMPVLLKTLARGRAPFQWTGGLLHSIPKPGKSACCPEGWRSILLLEADGKAILKAERHGLVAAFQRSRAAAQAGGLPGLPLSVPASFVRAHLVSLKQQNVSGGIVFFDVKSAYYSVIRHLLISTRLQRQDPDFARLRANDLFADPVLREHFVYEFQRGNLLAALGADEATVAYFQAHLRCTWYVTRRDATQVYQANSGTAPGSLSQTSSSDCCLAVSLTAYNGSLRSGA